MSAETVVIPRNFVLLEELEKAEKGATDMAISYGLIMADDISLSDWQCTIIGPQNSAVDNRVINLVVRCGPKYPVEAPEALFQTKVNYPFVVRRLPHALLHTRALPRRYHAAAAVRCSRPRLTPSRPYASRPAGLEGACGRQARHQDLDDATPHGESARRDPEALRVWRLQKAAAASRGPLLRCVAGSRAACFRWRVWRVARRRRLLARRRLRAWFSSARRRLVCSCFVACDGVCSGLPSQFCALWRTAALAHARQL